MNHCHQRTWIISLISPSPECHIIVPYRAFLKHFGNFGFLPIFLLSVAKDTSISLILSKLKLSFHQFPHFLFGFNPSPLSVIIFPLLVLILVGLFFSSLSASALGFGAENSRRVDDLWTLNLGSSFLTLQFSISPWPNRPWASQTLGPRNSAQNKGLILRVSEVNVGAHLRILCRSAQGQLQNHSWLVGGALCLRSSFLILSQCLHMSPERVKGSLLPILVEWTSQPDSHTRGPLG